ncbi:O-methyltransferase [Thermodesulfobacteriota bacterium]
MKKSIFLSLIVILPVLISFCPTATVAAQELTNEQLFDKKVSAFLNRRQGTWVDMNVPASDGKVLYDIIVKNNYTSALEIGTSTGHSAIWIAWALSKTGGKLVTIEIDRERHREAVANFEAAGLKDYIDARLADAHVLVKELKGPFDFVFCDADKGWYKNYFIDIYPKLKTGGAYTAHNISDKRWGRRGMSGTAEFYDYVSSLPNMVTTVDASGAGISISYKNPD